MGSRGVKDPQSWANPGLCQQVAFCPVDVRLTAGDQQRDGAVPVSCEIVVAIREKILQVQNVVGGHRCNIVECLASFTAAVADGLFTVITVLGALGNVPIGQIYHKKNRAFCFKNELSPDFCPTRFRVADIKAVFDGRNIYKIGKSSGIISIRHIYPPLTRGLTVRVPIELYQISQITEQVFVKGRE